MEIKVDNISINPSNRSVKGTIEFDCNTEELKIYFCSSLINEMASRLGCTSIEELESRINKFFDN